MQEFLLFSVSFIFRVGFLYFICYLLFLNWEGKDRIEYTQGFVFVFLLEVWFLYYCLSTYMLLAYYLVTTFGMDDLLRGWLLHGLSRYTGR